jgi:hypothetical protein
MDNLIQLTSAPSILIKDFTNQWDWKLINLEIDKQTWTHGNNFKVTDSKKILSESLQIIKQDILYECTMFINNLCPLSFKYKLDISSSWVNEMNYQEQHPWHTHPFSVVSGVIFLDDHPENTKLTFKNNINHAIPPYSLLDLQYYTALEHLIDRNIDGNLQYHLVLFYSNLLHSVPPLTNIIPRRSISFNTFWTGDVDFGDELNSRTFL